MSRRSLRLLAGLAARFPPTCVALVLAWALNTPVSADPRDKPPAELGGSLAWLSSDGLDLVGDIRVELPFWYRDGNRVFLRLNTRMTIEDTASNFQFIVRDLEYALDVGWRGLRGKLSGGPMTALVGQRGKEFVDVDGQPWVRYVAFGRVLPGYVPVSHVAPC